MCLPWFEGSDYTWCTVVSCFSMLWKRGVVQEAFHSSVEGLIENEVTRHFRSYLMWFNLMLYIIFIKSFLLIIPTFRFRSRHYFISYWLFFHMLHFLHLYLFLVSSVFLMFLTFTCAPVHPSTCFHFSFHMLWLCSQPFLSYYDILYFYVLSSLRSRFIPTQYINDVSS